ncbi:LytR/AlgR family response regulator transcription factor [Spirosoma montaniterrae]|uniref:LytTR family transcriptional regulator n=1 Tax=Spirosoma montaniterrae TaxID=1178516 RepID=A0A1P9WX79_9BACT|nr:LytTR family DNA-binding domain-containing protein [Spirosoma montaniterrae]AQG79994.1 LytTR family transcriptional regulator [Spirosoma montaniterrae]
MKINSVIIDDDSQWRTILTKMVQMNPLLHLIGSCSSAMEAYALMTGHEVDLLLCDIEMPEISGLAFIRSMKQPPLVIFVTSHRDYALDCYEVSPVDFLLKPIDLARFLHSVEKARLRLQQPADQTAPVPYFFVRENQQYVQITYDDVLYMQAQENFLHIVTTTQTIVPTLSIAKLEEQLKGDHFLRVHRSFIVHRAAISRIGKNELILTTGQTIPIGDQYRSQLHRKHIGNQLVSRTI